MGLLDRFRRDRDAAAQGPPPEPEHLQEGTAALPLTPESRTVGPEERARIETALEGLAAEGVDVDDLASIGAGLDGALGRWLASGGDGHDEIVERYAVAIGEHLTRRTDLAWQVVTDAFGTDLAVAAGEFVVVPHNLVAVRWMRRETGWVPSVVGHLVALRTR